VQRAASPIYEEAWLQPRVLKRCSMDTVCSGYSSCALGKLEGHPQHRSGPNRAPSGRWARLPDPSAKHGAGRASSQRAARRRDMRPGTCPLPPRDLPTSAPRDSPTSAPAMCDLRAQTSPARAVGGAHAPDRRSAAEEQMHPWHGTVLGGAPGYSGVLIGTQVTHVADGTPLLPLVVRRESLMCVLHAPEHAHMHARARAQQPHTAVTHSRALT
jgi:hypothetical protein